MPCSKRTGADDIENFHKFAQISSQKRDSVIIAKFSQNIVNLSNTN
jgi:hypothetical protein